MKYIEMENIFGIKKTDFEFNQLISLEQVLTDDNFCRIVILTTSSCNYDCYYCSKPEGALMMSFNTFKFFIDNYLKKIPFKRILFYYFGGEPTLNKDLELMLDYLGEQKDPRVTQIVQSNGSANTDFYKRMGEKEYDLKFSLSYHPSIIQNQKEAQKRFIKNSYILFESNTINGVILMLPDDKYLKEVEFVYEILNLKMKKSDLVEFFPIFQSCNDLSDVSKEKFLNQSSTKVKIKYREDNKIKTKILSLEKMMGLKMFHYQGMKCYPGHLILDYNGDYYKCWASQYQKKDMISNIFNLDFDRFHQLMTVANICPHTVCLADVFTKKEKNND